MLIHVTLTHAPEDCPVYNRERIPTTVAAMDQAIGDRAKELNVKIHFWVNGTPDHIQFLLVEAESSYDIAQLVRDIPTRQGFKLTPVVPIERTVEGAKAMTAKG